MRNKFLGTGEPGYHPLRKIRTILSGLRYAVVYDFSVAWKLLVSLVVLLAAAAFRDWVDVVLIIVVTSLVLVAEIMNSAIEALCDFVETRHNEKIGVIKDIAAAGVGVAMLAWLLVLTCAVGVWAAYHWFEGRYIRAFNDQTVLFAGDVLALPADLSGPGPIRVVHFWDPACPCNVGNQQQIGRAHV